MEVIGGGRERKRAEEKEERRWIEAKQTCYFVIRVGSGVGSDGGNSISDRYHPFRLVPAGF